MTTAAFSQADIATVDEIIGAGRVVLFLNGTPTAPKCSGSAIAISILIRINVDYEAIDVSQNPEIKLALQHRSGVLGLPQLYSSGSLIAVAGEIADLFQTGRASALLL